VIGSNALKATLEAWILAEDPFEGAPVIISESCLPEFKVDELCVMQISIAPRSSESRFISRGDAVRDLVFDITVQKKIDGSIRDLNEIKEYLTVVEQIGDFLRRRENWKMEREGRNYMFQHMVNNPPYSEDHLKEFKVFTSVLTTTYVLR
jgi:hypothetical protein